MRQDQRVPRRGGWTSSWANADLRLVHAPKSFATLDGLWPEPRAVFSGEVTFKFARFHDEDFHDVIMSSHGDWSGWEVRADAKKGTMLLWTVDGYCHL